VKILIVVSTLSFGGAERTAANISRALSASHKITILAFHGHATYPYGGKLVDCSLAYEPDADLLRKPARLYMKSRAFRSILSQENPDVVLSFGDGQNLVSLIKLSRGRRHIINSQNPPSLSYTGINKHIYTRLIRKLYPRADCAIALSEGVKIDLVTNFGLPAEKVRVIYNPIDCKQAQSDAEEEVAEPLFETGMPVILNVGRLVVQKNQALLIQAFARARRDVPAKLAFLGQGPLELELRALAERLGVEKDVHFLGWRSNPFKYMRRAQVFALSSNYEGFGNVLVEAMACGCPVISTDCPYGPGEIVENAKNGLLVPMRNKEALADAMSTMLADESLRQGLAAAGKERAKDFDLPVIARQYELTLENALKSR
jgi:glycosyltransferase involved in cell wall biosynthesis